MTKKITLDDALSLLQDAGYTAVNRSHLNEAVKMAQKAGYQVGYKNDPGSTSLANTPALQGPLQGNPSVGGAFATPGVRPQRFSAMPRVLTLATLLTPEPNEFYNEKIGIVTGATDATGSNPDSFCGDPPQTGALKRCIQNYQFGKWYMGTHLNDLNDIGLLYDRADVPGEILNSAPEMYPLVPDIMWRLVDTRSQLQYELWLQGVAMERAIEPVLVNGNPALSNAQTQRGFIKEFLGLSSQIKTGYVDSDSGLACAAADSIVINFGTNIGGTIGGGDGRTITTTIGDLVYAAKRRAARVGMQGTEWAFIMPEELFRAITDYYANTYLTSRFQAATLTAGSPVVQIATDTDARRLEMLNGNFLLVEGVPYPVVFSDGMQFDGQGANTYISDLFFVPLSWAGRKLLRLEYFNLGNQYIQEFAGFLNPDRRRVINNGLYAMTYRSTGNCDQYLFSAQMRLILETPFLAGRIDNIQYQYLADTRRAIPGQSLYANGGISYSGNLS